MNRTGPVESHHAESTGARRFHGWVTGLAGLLIALPLLLQPALSRDLALRETKEKAPLTREQVNPHNSLECTACHAKAPGTTAGAGDRSKTALVKKLTADRLCGECHDGNGHLHPTRSNARKAKPAMTVPAFLPVASSGPDKGMVSCTTCHLVHAANADNRLLRGLSSPRLPADPVADRIAFCRSCHNADPKKDGKIASPPSLLATNPTDLCNRCHDSGQALKMIHPLGGYRAEFLKRNRMPADLPLLNGKELTCLTCHTPGDRGKADPANPFFLRGGPYADLNAPCWRCHTRSEFSKLDPHQDIQTGQGCAFCHATAPDLTKKIDIDQLEITQNSSLLCLRCHDDIPHPAGARHAGAASSKTTPQYYQPDKSGKLGCISCHNPHVSGSSKTRGMAVGLEVCPECHKRGDTSPPAPPASPPSPSYYRSAPATAQPSVSARQSVAKKSMAYEQSSDPGKPTYDGFGETFDEVWVISRPEGQGQVVAGPDDPGSGELRYSQKDGKTVPFPLKHTEVSAKVTGYIARVTVQQQYQNPFAEKIEAVYVFPLPENAAVSDFVMTIGDRKIRGIIREKEEATRIYMEARAQGYAASLLTQERPNIFTQKVANIEPGKRIDIDITYFNTLAYQDGSYTFVFPMVVGPRYNPAGSTDGVGAVARGAAGVSGQSTEVQYLKPGERSGHDIMVTVDIDAGLEIEEIESPQHAIDVTRKGRTAARIRLRPADTLPNKDLVLRYKVAGKQVKSALMVERTNRGGYFTLMLQPPGNLADVPRGGLEMVFLLDVSGSMSGYPLEKSKAATRRALQNLRPGDTFQIVYFASGFGTMADQPIPATPENVERGIAFLDRLSGGGGTEMLRGIQAALTFPHDPRRLRYVAFMTDGFVGNDDEILAAVAEKLGPSRIFSFGIGTSVNRYLMEGLARLGKGAVAYMLKGDSDIKPIDLFFERIAHAALTDIAIDWGGMTVTDVYPKRIPDLFIGRPVVITGRFEGRGDAKVKVTGLSSGEPQTFTIVAPLDDPEASHEGISRIWARARIADLSDAMLKAGRRGESLDLAGDIKKTALDYGLVSTYTAFVAVDSSRVTEGDHGTTVVQPVPMPDGVKYETTVQGGK
jgi:Ca-activated chloride channel family protein